MNEVEVVLTREERMAAFETNALRDMYRAIIRDLFETADDKDRSKLIGIRNLDVTEVVIRDRSKKTWNVRQEQAEDVVQLKMVLMYDDMDDEAGKTERVETLNIDVIIPRELWTSLFDSWLHM